MFNIFLWINIKILLPLIVFGFLMGKLRMTAYQNFWRKTRNYLLIDFFNLVGTPVHETGHLLFGLLFGYRPDQICLYRTMRSAKAHGGTLGFVKMHHRRGRGLSRLQENLGLFFMGIGPLLFGPAFLWLCSRLLPGDLRSLPSLAAEDFSRAVQTVRGLDWKDYLLLALFVYLMIGVSVNMELSRQDLTVAAGGFLLLELIFLLVSAACSFLYPDALYLIDRAFHSLVFLAGIGIFCGLFANLLALL